VDPVYVDFRKTETGSDPRFWYVRKAAPQARRAVGQWPTAEGLVERPSKALNDAADREQEPERENQLRQAAGLLADGGHDVAVEVAATIIGSRPTSADPAGR
jgi:hypothetical protein